jgi:AraC-like DNA-binding protein
MSLHENQLTAAFDARTSTAVVQRYEQLRRGFACVRICFPIADQPVGMHVQQNDQNCWRAPRYTCAMRTTAPDSISLRQGIRLRQARAVVMHRARAIAAADLASAPHYCHSHMRALHMRYSGEAMAAAARRYALDQAAARLIRTRDAIHVIAYAAAYASQAAFARAFARQFALSPTAFRKQIGPSPACAKALQLSLAFAAYLEK